MTEEFKKEISELLSTLYKDAEMAINEEWDKSDSGFETQQHLITLFCYKYNIPLVVDKKDEENEDDC